MSKKTIPVGEARKPIAEGSFEQASHSLSIISPPPSRRELLISVEAGTGQASGELNRLRKNPRGAHHISPAVPQRSPQAAVPKKENPSSRSNISFEMSDQ
jgi:hypothetical protein